MAPNIRKCLICILRNYYVFVTLDLSKRLRKVYYIFDTSICLNSFTNSSKSMIDLPPSFTVSNAFLLITLAISFCGIFPQSDSEMAFANSSGSGTVNLPSQTRIANP
uniref:Uncharacterized protein n=1 Tax=Opuntia streptacantha TaxID=393608 RepID=A0A7C9D1J3_OPUST